MFYLQTKDGERFFTEATSDDQAEFRKIIESKLGEDAATLFDNVVLDNADQAASVLADASLELKACIRRFDKILNEAQVDTVKLEGVLSEFQLLYNTYFF